MPRAPAQPHPRQPGWPGGSQFPPQLSCAGGCAPAPGPPPPPRPRKRRAEPRRAQPGRAELSRADPSRAVLCRVGQSRTEPNRAEPGQGGPGSAKPGRAAPSRAEPGRAGHSRRSGAFSTADTDSARRRRPWRPRPPRRPGSRGPRGRAAVATPPRPGRSCGIGTGARSRRAEGWEPPPCRHPRRCVWKWSVSPGFPGTWAPSPAEVRPVLRPGVQTVPRCLPSCTPAIRALAMPNRGPGCSCPGARNTMQSQSCRGASRFGLPGGFQSCNMVFSPFCSNGRAIVGKLSVFQTQPYCTQQWANMGFSPKISSVNPHILHPSVPYAPLPGAVSQVISHNHHFLDTSTSP